MKLTHDAEYRRRGLADERLANLERLGDLILGAGFNITSVQVPIEIERQHFLDSLSLLDIEEVRQASTIVDIGSGGGLPALVLALALPTCQVTALESQRKKCAYVEQTAGTMRLQNMTVVCARAEDYGRGGGRGQHDVAVSRAVASLPVVAEYSVPLLKQGGTMIAMKGLISDQERIEATTALGILGADGLDAVRLEPFEGAANRWAFVAHKVRPTPREYPRRPGTPVKRPLGAA